MAGLIAVPAAAAPWDAVIGAWRTPEIDSCGVDDARIGRLTSVSETAMMIGHVICTIKDGAETGETVRITGACDLGGGYMVDLDYEWRLTSETEAVMSNEGYETALVRCERGVE
ncbi:MAG: hypothetical protein AAFU55_14620 [Pseudomonadota bacterium]